MSRPILLLTQKKKKYRDSTVLPTVLPLPFYRKVTQTSHT